MKLPEISKKSIIVGAAVLAIGGSGLIYYLNSQKTYDGSAWVDSNWLYRRTVAVENTGGGVSNEDVLVTVDTASLISAGKMRSNCEDFRFTDSDDGTYLSYWIEDDCNTSSTKIWVRIPSLPSGGKNIYMYYGNSAASAGTLSWGGNIYMYSDSTCPAGWSRATAMDNRFLYGSSTFGSTGGSDTHTHNNVACSSTSISTTSVAAAAPYSIHTFTSSGTFTVNQQIVAEVLVVAGGGGGGSNGGGGGGGGGVVYNSGYTFAAGSYSVTVGGGGAAGSNTGRGGNGGNSSIGTLTAIGGGGGASSSEGATSGGSGGGGSKDVPAAGGGTAGQGYAGGAGYASCNIGGGGGAGGAGSAGSTNTSQCWLSYPGSGGNAFASSISGVTKYYGGGGGGAAVGYSYTKQRGAGVGGGGYGGFGLPGSNGTPNTGGGGGGGAGSWQIPTRAGGAGGSGIVIIKYYSGGKASGGAVTPISATSPSTTHTHSSMSNVVNSSANLPAYRNMLLCYRKKFTFPTGSVTQFPSLPVTGWSRYTNLDNTIPRVASTSGAVAGSNTHAHTLAAINTSGAVGDVLGMAYFAGSGGSVTTSGANRIHTFNGSGTFTATGNGVAEVLVVAGGGGGANTGSGGGAGGFINRLGFGINAGSYGVTVGGGGAGGASSGAGGGNGGNSVFSSITAIGGGGGRTHGGTEGVAGGSGSGGPLRTATPDATGGAGTAGQGNAGGQGYTHATWDGANGGGGGAGSVGGACSVNGSGAGTGGYGWPSWITGSEKFYAGGGYGGEVNQASADSTGSLGGGGVVVLNGAGGNGVANTGGGGGGGSYNSGTYMNGGAGGSGVVVISYIATGAVYGSTSNHVHATSSSSASSSSNLPPYMKLLFGQATSDSYVTSDHVLITSENPPLGYNRFTGLDSRYAMGSTAYGEVGGAGTHTHSTTLSTGSPSSTVILASGTGINIANTTHTHSCSTTSSAASNLPSYYSVIYTQRKNSKVVTLGAEITQNEAPYAPSSLLTDSLTDPTGVSSLTPKFSAIYTDPNASDLSTHYQIQVNTNSSFTGTMLWDTGVTAFASGVSNGSRTPDITYAGTALQWGVTYYWRIKLWDNNTMQMESPWSDVGQFTINYKPNIPTELKVNGTVNPSGVSLNPVPTFSALFTDADASDTGNTYYIQVNTSPTFDGVMKWNSGTTAFVNPIANGSPTPQIQYGGSSLLSGITYYWRIKIGDSRGTESDWSAVGEFITNFQPNKPTNLFTNDTVEPTWVSTVTPPMFSAIFTDPDSADTCGTYQIQLNTALTFDGTMKWDSQVINVVGTVNNGGRIPQVAYGGSALLPGTTYYWRIKLGDNKGIQSDWSSITQFTTNYAPSTPTTLLTSGAVNPSKVSLTPTFSSVYTDPDVNDKAVAYQVVVSESPTLAEPVLWDSTKSSFSTPVANNTRTPEITYAGTPVEETTTYYWEMKLWDSKDLSSDYSVTSQFTTLTSPSAPTGLLTNGLVTPGILPSRVVSFSAMYSDGDGDNATGYQIQVSSSSTFDTVLFDSGKKATSIVSGQRSPDYYFDGSSVLTNSGTTYYWRIKFFDVDNAESDWSTSASFQDLLVASSFLFDGVKIDGVKIN